MKNEMCTKLNAALQNIVWHGGELVLQIIRQQRKPVLFTVSSRTMLLTGILLLAFCVAAAALPLYFSSDFGKKVQSKRGIQIEYGLSDEMLDLFTYRAMEPETGVASIFTADNVHRDQLGTHPVR